MKTVFNAILVASLAIAAAANDKNGPKDYPLALEVYGTQSVNNPHDTSVAKASDGNMYVIACADRSGASRFRAAVKAMENEKDAAAEAKVPDCGGVTLVPGVPYRARWNKGELKILVSSTDGKSKPKESTYTVIRSQKMTVDEMQDCKACVLVKEQ